MNNKRVVFLILTGLLVGLFAGLFGIGGGIILVPMLIYVFKFPHKLAAGTSLMSVIFPVSSAVVTYLWQGHYDLVVAALLAVGSSIGAQIGARLLHRINPQIIRFIFIIILFSLVVSLFVDISRPESQVHLDITTGVIMIFLGLAIGILASLLGIGGGSMVVPILIAGFGMGDVVAKGTALLMVFASIISGTIVNHKLKQVDFKSAIILGISAMILAPAGAWLATIISPLVSNILFVALLVGVGIRILIDIFKMRRHSDKKV